MLYIIPDCIPAPKNCLSSADTGPGKSAGWRLGFWHSSPQQTSSSCPNGSSWDHLLQTVPVAGWHLQPTLMHLYDGCSISCVRTVVALELLNSGNINVYDALQYCSSLLLNIHSHYDFPLSLRFQPELEWSTFQYCDLIPVCYCLKGKVLIPRMFSGV